MSTGRLHGAESLEEARFLAMTRSGWWLIDVRPAALVREADVVAFAATAEAALACGRRYSVVGG